MTYLYALNVALLIFDARSFHRKPDSMYVFLRLCFSIVIGLGIPFLELMDHAVGYKFVLRDLDMLEYAYLLGYASILVGGTIGAAVERTLPPKPTGLDAQTTRASSTTEMALLSLVVISFGCVVIYVALTGLSFGQGSYQVRYENAQGNGLLLLFFPAFLPYVAYRLHTSSSARQFLSVSAVALLYSLFLFFVLDGYRQILIAAGLLVGIIGFKQGLISGRWLLFGALIAAPASLLGLSFLRYVGEASSPFRSALAAGFYYIQGDLFPVDAPLRAAWHCQLKECPGAEVIANHLLRFVPRYFWPDKPLLLPDAAGYYTVFVVGYQRYVTLSATIIGEAIFVGGTVALAVLLFLAGLITRLTTMIMDRSSGVLKYVLLANVYMGFFWVREGFANGLYRLIVITIFLMTAVVAAPFLKSLLKAIPRKERTRATGPDARRSSLRPTSIKIEVRE